MIKNVKFVEIQLLSFRYFMSLWIESMDIVPTGTEGSLYFDKDSGHSLHIKIMIRGYYSIIQ